MKEIILTEKLYRQLSDLKKENKQLHAIVLASINSLSTYRINENYLVTKVLEKGLYELKVDSHNKYIRIFYTEDKKEILCIEMLEKKSKKIPSNVMRRIRKHIK